MALVIVALALSSCDQNITADIYVRDIQDLRNRPIGTACRIRP